MDYPEAELLPYYFEFEKLPKIPFNQHFPMSPPGLADLLEKMLALNPAHRITTAEIASHKFFDHANSTELSEDLKNWLKSVDKSC